MPLPDRTPAPARALALHAGNHLARALGAAEGHQHLVQHDVVEYGKALARQARGERFREPAGTLDEILESRAPELAQRRPHFDTARAARKVRSVLVGNARLTLGEIGGSDGERRAQRIRVARQHQAAVIGNVQPLVGIGRPGVGVFDAPGEVRARRSSGGPESEGTIDVYPRPAAADVLANLGDGIEGTGIHIAGLHAHDGALGDWRHLLPEHAPLSVAGHARDPLAPETDHREGLLHARVHFLADHDGDRRRAKQALGLDVPAGACQQGVARGRERREVRGRGAGHETAATVPGQMKQILQPIQRNLFELGADR